LPEKLKAWGCKFERAIVLELSTNRRDNDANKPRLKAALEQVAQDVQFIEIDGSGRFRR
jgi:hypothetical protein